MVVDEQTVGPFTLEEIKIHPKLTPETLVWKPGIENWIPARQMSELNVGINNPYNGNNQCPPNPHHHPGGDNFRTTNQGGVNPGGGYSGGNLNPNRNYYNPNPGGYDQGYRPPMRTNWLPWAIVATVVGFLTSCIGAIFGIIGIVQANKANTLYAQGLEREGDSANSSAKTMTIIGLIFAGLGLIAVLFYFGTLGAFLGSYY